MKIGIVSLGGKSSRRLANSCKNYFQKVDELDIRKFKVNLNSNNIGINYNGSELKDYDCLFLRGSFRYAMLQRAITTVLRNDVYIPFEPKTFTLAHDKFLTLVELQKNKIPIPKTYFAANKKLAKKILKKEVRYPVIIKVQEGTHGKGVMVAESLKSAKTILDMLDEFKKPYIIQEFVKTKGTSDIRVIISGKKVAASYRRVADEEEIRTNIHAGGKREKHELSKKEKKLALRAARAVGAETCGVDVFHSKTPAVIEVNLSPSLYPIEDITGIDVIDKIAKFLYKRTKKFKKKKKEKFNKKIKKLKKKNNKKSKKKKEEKE